MKHFGQLRETRQKARCREHSCKSGRSSGIPYCTAHQSKKSRHHDKAVAVIQEET